MASPNQYKAVFITFYSFKGGVGRTMSLANVASILAGRGRRVLMIDFDLEAPGLTALKNSTISSNSNCEGLIELIEDFLHNPDKSLLSSNDKSLLRDRYICNLKIPEALKLRDNGYLDLMPCGRVDETYIDRLNKINFSELYEQGFGRPLFQYFKQVIQTSELYDYVFIDSRTGFSDEGGICTRDLADHLVVLLGLNHQNVTGTGQFLRSLKSSDWQEGQVIFVASPVPSHNEDLLEERLATAKKTISDAGFQTDLALQIPYHPRLALDENPFLYPWSKTTLFAAYTQIHDNIRQLANDNPQRSIDLASEAISRRRFSEAINWLTDASVENSDIVVQFLKGLTSRQLDVELRKQAEPFFTLWFGLDENDALAHRRYAQILMEEKEYAQAELQLSISLRIAANQMAKRDEIQTRIALADLARIAHDYEKSLFELEFALTVASDINDANEIARIYLLLGRVHLDVDELSLALKYFNLALDINALNTRNHSIRRYISIVHRFQGKLQQAQNIIDLQIEMMQALGNRIELAHSYIQLADILYGLGNYVSSYSTLELAFIEYTVLDDKLGLASTSLRYAQLNTIHGQYTEAYQHIIDAAKIREDSSFLQILHGDILMDEERYEDALIVLEQAIILANQSERSSLIATILSLIGRLNISMGNKVEGFEKLNQALNQINKSERVSLKISIYLNYIQALYSDANFNEAFDYLQDWWSFIHKHGSMLRKMYSYVLRAKIKTALGTAQDAVDDLQIALNHYRENDIRNHDAREAESLAISISTQ